jgi:hypothetical protein
MNSDNLRERLRDTREGLSVTQVELLRRLCAVGISEGEYYSPRVLFSGLSPVEARQEIDDLVPHAVRQIAAPGEEQYQATLLGHLLCDQDGQLLRDLERYLYFLSSQYRHDPRTEQIHSDELKRAYEWDDARIASLYRPVYLLGIHAGTGQGGGAWHARVPYNVHVVSAISDYVDVILRIAFNEVTPSDLQLLIEPADGRSKDTPLPLDLQRESVYGAAATDQPSVTDVLGFAPYVDAVAAFLANPNTVPPLAMSVEGDWGSGKSSFMLQLKAKLAAGHHKTVVFNAWRHDKSEALWAAFAMESLHALGRQVAFWKRLRASLTLLRLRYSWRDGWWGFFVAFLRAVGVAVVLASVAAVLVRQGTKDSLALFGLVGDKEKADALKGLTVSSAWAAWGLIALLSLRRAKEFLGNPILEDLKKHVDKPRYSDHVAFIEHFHRDFNRILHAYLRKGERLFVLIDDLDRCEMPQAAELLQAINLMIGESPRVMFVIGMDRRKVAAAIVHKYRSAANGTEQAPLDLGYAYIEKLVQIPFRLPEPRTADVARFLRSLSVAATGPGQSLSTTKPAASGVTAPAPSLDSSEKPLEVFEQTRIETDMDSATVRNAVATLSPFVQKNPRRLKQLLNLLRLRICLGSKTGLFAGPAGADRVSIEQLAKFIVIELRWPSLIAELVDRPALLAQLEVISGFERAREAIEDDKRKLDRDFAPAPVPTTEDELAILRTWAKHAELGAVLRAGIRSRPGDFGRSPWSMCGLDVGRLLAVAPPVLVRPPVAASERKTDPGKPSSDYYEMSEVERAELERDPDSDLRKGKPQFRPPPIDAPA